MWYTAVQPRKIARRRCAQQGEWLLLTATSLRNWEGRVAFFEIERRRNLQNHTTAAHERDDAAPPSLRGLRLGSLWKTSWDTEVSTHCDRGIPIRFG